jgi:hypothetical protein
MSDDITRLRLPHTGLRVPDRSLSVTGYRSRNTEDGVWFRATINIQGTKVGQVENDGYGGPTGYCGDPDHPIYGDTEIALTGYAARCRTEEGDKLTNLEALIDEIVSEHEWERKAADAAAKRKVLLRLMDHLLSGDDKPVPGFPPCPMASNMAGIPATKQHWAKLRQVLTDTPGLKPGPYGWWQAWHEDRWQDVTRRPASVTGDLYN